MKKPRKLENKRVILATIITLIIGIPHAFSQEEYHPKTTLQSMEPNSNSNFGICMALSDDYIVLGEPRASAGEVQSAGNVHIFDSQGNHIVTLQSPQPTSAKFGGSLAVKGDVVVVGEPRATGEDGEKDTGNVYVFDSDGNLLKSLRSPDPNGHVFYGWSVAFCGDNIMVGEPGREVEGIPLAGKVYKYNLEGAHLSTLQSPEPNTGYVMNRVGLNFGYSLAGIDGILVVSEPYTKIDEMNQAGKAYIFDDDGNLLATLQSPKPQTLGKFGLATAIHGDIIVIGESFADVDEISRAGKAHIYDIDGNLLYTLQPPQPEEGAEFGVSVAVNDYAIVVGEHMADSVEMNEGKAYVFSHDGSLLATIQSPNPEILGDFGFSVGIGKENIVVGEPGSTIDGERKAGKAYLFCTESAEFNFMNLKMSSTKVSKDKAATISVDCTNIGTVSGSTVVCMNIDGEMIEEKTVTVDTGQTETVSFTFTTGEVGVHKVEIEDLISNFEVTDAPPGPTIPWFPVIAIGLLVTVYLVYHLSRKQ